MNQRQRILIFILIGTILLAGGGFLVYWMLGSGRGKTELIGKLENDVTTLTVKLEQMRANRAKLERWKQQSLPSDTELARREYEKFLSELLRDSKLAPGSFTVTPKPEDSKSSPKLPNKQPIYTKLDFTVAGRGQMESLVTLLQKFYTTGLLHQIKNLSIQKPLTGATRGSDPAKLRELDFTFTVEALVINGAEKRGFLVPVGQIAAGLDLLGARQRGVGGAALAVAAASPGGFASPSKLATKSRNYDTLAARNIFVGPPPGPPDIIEMDTVDKDALNHVYLTDITANFLKTEAFLWDRASSKPPTRLATRIAYKEFKVGDISNPAVKGEVMKIDEMEREVIFKTSDGKFYAIKLGQNLADAMKKELPAEKVKEFTDTKSEVDVKTTEATP